MNSPGSTGRRLVVVCAAVGLFAGGVAVGWFAARFTPGDSGELLVQIGEIDAINNPKEFDVFYPRPYARPPALKINDEGSGLLAYEITQQRTDGFRLRINASGSDRPARYEARGLPAK